MTGDPEWPFRETAHFLSDVMGAKVLSAALSSGIIDRLASGPLSLAELHRRFALAPTGVSLLATTLEHTGVIERRGTALRLTPRFHAVLAWRDLLEARLEFASLVLPDFTELTSALLGTGEDFMARSTTFDLFRYDRAKHRSPENHAATERWVRLLSILSRYEASGLLRHLAQGDARMIIDVGGNGGVLAHALCAAWQESEAQVFDLPVVCDIGRKMHEQTQSNTRMQVRFVEGDLRHDALPSGADLIVFKSVLHDWPDHHIISFLEKAKASLNPGGRIAIFERMPFAFNKGMPAFHDLPNLMFMHVLRPPSLYREMLSSLSLNVIQQDTVLLDMPFSLTVATA